jgi:hypothetical protein
MNDTKTLLTIIRDHGHRATSYPDGTIEATSDWTGPDGLVGESSDTIEATTKAVLDWLGY